MRTPRAVPTCSTFLFVAAFLAPLAACSGEAATASPETTANVAAAETVATAGTASTGATAAPSHPQGGHGGPDGLIMAALHEPINLTADQQKSIQALLTTASPRGPHPFGAALAAGIRAGTVDTTPTFPTDAELAAHRATTVSALNALHATLTATQRRALVDAIEQKGAEHGKHRGANDHHDPHGPMGHLLEGIDLTAAQQQEIESKLDAARPPPPSDSDRAAMEAEHEAGHVAMKAKLETFAGETFDAAAFVTPPPRAMKPDGHRDHFLADLAIVTSVLDAAQREKLAERIEAGSPPPGAPPVPSP